MSLGLSKERTATVKLELSDSSNFFKYLTGMMAVTDYRLCCGYGNSGTDTRGFDCLIIPGARSQNGQDLNAGTLNFHPLLHFTVFRKASILSGPGFNKFSESDFCGFSFFRENATD